MGSAGHGGLRIGEAEYDTTDSTFEGEFVEGGLSRDKIRDYGLAGVEGFEGVGGAVDVKGNLAALGVPGETCAVGETGSSDGCPEGSFDGVEVGEGDHEGRDAGIFQGVGAFGDGESEGGVDCGQRYDIRQVSGILASVTETGEAGFERSEGFAGVEVRGQTFPCRYGVGEFFQIADNKDAKVGVLAKGGTDGFELGEDCFGRILEETLYAFEVDGADKGASGSSDGGGSGVEHYFGGIKHAASTTLLIGNLCQESGRRGFDSRQVENPIPE